MQLSKFRAQFVELSGRDDLALAPSSAIGITHFKKRADFFIQAG